MKIMSRWIFILLHLKKSALLMNMKCLHLTARLRIVQSKQFVGFDGFSLFPFYNSFEAFLIDKQSLWAWNCTKDSTFTFYFSTHSRAIMSWQLLWVYSSDISFLVDINIFQLFIAKLFILHRFIFKIILIQRCDIQYCWSNI